MPGNAQSGTDNIKIFFLTEYVCVKFSREKLTDMLQKTCIRFGLSAAQINLAVVDSASIRKINRRFLKSAKNTDVISFDISEEGQQRFFDIVINAELALRQAEENRTSAESELALYALHGVLHNLGFDDTTPEAAEKMHRTEDLILQQSGYGIVYAAN